MTRRVIAWLMLAAFIFLIINILYLGWYREASAYIYFVVAVSFFFYSVFKNRAERIADNQDDKTENNDNNHKD